MSDIAGMPVLALILFAPWFLILSVMYWVYPRQPRDARRRLFDAVALLVAFVAFVFSLHWSFGFADRFGRFGFANTHEFKIEGKKFLVNHARL